MTNEEMIETEGHNGQLEHHPHIGHALTHMAAELTETIEAQAIAIDQLRAADKEIERLRDENVVLRRKLESQTVDIERLRATEKEIERIVTEIRETIAGRSLAQLGCFT